jgi:hypothetical protein
MLGKRANWGFWMLIILIVIAYVVLNILITTYRQNAG